MFVGKNRKEQAVTKVVSGSYIYEGFNINCGLSTMYEFDDTESTKLLPQQNKKGETQKKSEGGGDDQMCVGQTANKRNYLGFNLNRRKHKSMYSF